ncbi:MAG: GIY-YIG nuclease family protein [Proteobacteria bacterium]|nr:GIY-YIG nuclease family protein [Pseudomonadota bacterium]
MYILQCADGSFYTGSTKDLSYRLVQHKKGEGAQHTKVNEPVKLIYCEIFEQIDKAFDREQQLKKWSRAKKIALINKDIERLRELSSWSESVINSV